MKLMIPYIPHLANECLELYRCRDVNSWPKVDLESISEEIKIAIQINGITRDILSMGKNLDIKKINKLVIENSEDPTRRLGIDAYREYELLDTLALASVWSSGTTYQVPTSEFFDDMVDSADLDTLSSMDKSKLVTSLIRKGYIEISG